ncbi:MAG: DUF1553 domain-containing protein [Planctomycetaceae bacterium]|nr:DUF1553 domain-containing protein [Planctomycetaceae bacterium]
MPHRSIFSAVLLRFLALIALMPGGTLLADEATADAEKLAFFENQIRPVLIRHCYECHSADSKELRGGLLVDSREGLAIGGDSGPAIQTDKPADSLLLKALKYEDGLEMPPAKKLPESVIADFETWIRNGAVDPRSGKAPVRKAAIDLEKGREFWSFRPLAEPPVPEGRLQWVRNEVDRFISADWPADVPPPQDAAPDVVLRRLSVVLTGLLPEPEEQEAFIKAWNQNPDDAIAGAVDRLLQSPRYAERWGRHWLDVVRFAESTGGGRSMMLPDAWRFRDYVIDSFRQDKPFPQLVREHIAGDLLPSSTDAQHDEQVIGSGYLMLGAINYEEQDKEQLRMDVVDEQIDSMGRTFLGMTLGCARCHDHKFDPVPTTDYYALAGIFRSTKALVPGNVSGWVTRPLKQGVDQAAIDAWKKKDGDLEKQIASLKQLVRKSGSRTSAPGLKDLPGVIVDDSDAVLEGVWTDSMFQQPFIGDGYRHSGQPRKGIKATYSATLPKDDEYVVRMVINHADSRSDRIPVMISHVDGETQVEVSQKTAPPGDGVFAELGRFRFNAGTPAKVVVLAEQASPGYVIVDAIQFVSTSMMPANEMPAELAGQSREQLESRLKALEEERKKHTSVKPDAPVAMCVEDEKQPGDWHLHVRGEIRNLGPVVPRGFLSVTEQASLSSRPKDGFAEASGRRELADWIASDSNPLTARVWANRIWLNVMGEGLVRTPDNFGTTGELPTHPKLLDFLASTLVHKDGWSTRAMIQRLCLSRTFRMSSIPDSNLASKDPDNRLWTHAFERRMDAETVRDCLLQISGQLDLNITGGPTIERLSQYDNEYRHADHPKFCRSVFVPTFRNSVLDAFEIFDAANPNSVVGRRNESTRPAQALYLMNSPFVAAQAKDAAERMLKSEDFQAADVDSRVNLVFRRCVGRLPVPEEKSVVLGIVGDDPNSETAWAEVFHSLFASFSFRHLQ